MEEKYYWLKIHEHFFDDEKIMYLETLDNGEKYILFWQKLLLKCLKNRHEDDTDYGFIRFSDKLPYTPELLSKVTRTDIDTVKVSIDMFQKLEMLEVLENGTIYIEAVSKLIGKESKSAERVRKHRERKKLLQCNDKPVTSNTNKRKEKKRKEKKEAVKEKKIAYRDNILLTEKEYNTLLEKYNLDSLNRILDKLSFYKLSKGKKYESDYGAINHWVIDALGFKKQTNTPPPPSEYNYIDHDYGVREGFENIIKI